MIIFPSQLTYAVEPALTFAVEPASLNNLTIAGSTVLNIDECVY